MYQVMCVTSTSFLPLVFWIFPQLAAYYGGIDGQWAVLGVCVLGLFSASLHGLLATNLRTQTAAEMLTLVFGKWIGKTVGISFVPGYLLFVLMSLYSYSISVKAVLPNTPRLATAGAVAFVAVVGALYGIETIARVASIAFPVVILILVTSFTLAFFRGTWMGVFPHPVSLYRSTSTAGLLLPLFFGINLYLMLNPYFDHRKRNAIWLPILVAGFACVYVMLVFMVTVRVVGYEGLRVLVHPIDFVLQLVQVQGFIIQRFGVFLIFVSTMFQAVFYANHLWGLSELSRQILQLSKSSDKWFVLGYATVVTVGFELVPNQEVGQWIVISILVPLSWLYLIVEPTAKLLVFYIRRKNLQPMSD